jgi:hypothetical protein
MGTSSGLLSSLSVVVDPMMVIPTVAAATDDGVVGVVVVDYEYGVYVCCCGLSNSLHQRQVKLLLSSFVIVKSHQNFWRASWIFPNPNGCQCMSV